MLAACRIDKFDPAIHSCTDCGRDPALPHVSDRLSASRRERRLCVFCENDARELLGEILTADAAFADGMRMEAKLLGPDRPKKKPRQKQRVGDNGLCAGWMTLIEGEGGKLSEAE